jgi:hypothetical protein
MDRSLAVGRGDHRRVFAGQGAFDRSARSVERSASMLRVDLTDRKKGVRTLFQKKGPDPFYGKAAAFRVRPQDRAVADEHRLAQRAHPAIERGLQADLGADAAGIADRDRYLFLFLNEESNLG